MRVAWITGGGTGIGRALAELLMRQGARVVITGRRKEILEQAADELAALAGGGQVLAISGSASDPKHAKDVISQVSDRWGSINLLVNNAGTNFNHSLLDTTFEEYLKSFEINCLSAINCTQAVLPEMLKKGRGEIVNISSIYGRWASSNSASYSVGKYAVTGYTDALRQALIHTPIHVMGVFPGFIRTDMTQPFVVPGSLRSRMGKSPDQLARAVLAALKSRKPELYYPWYVPWVLRLHRWFPLMADRLARRVKR
jgi:short-subunit dehydrogenase